MNDPNELLAVELIGFPPDEIALLRGSFAERFGIACFSADWNIPEMWASYGDNHSGICLGLEIPRLTKVRYVQERKQIPVPSYLYERFSEAVDSRQLTPTLARAFHPFLIRVFTTKLSQWEHEQEWRALPELVVAENGMYFSDFRGEDPILPMRSEARAAGVYMHSFTGRSYNRIDIVTIREIIGSHERLDLPLSIEALKAAPKPPVKVEQRDFKFGKQAG